MPEPVRPYVLAAAGVAAALLLVPLVGCRPGLPSSPADAQVSSSAPGSAPRAPRGRWTGPPRNLIEAIEAHDEAAVHRMLQAGADARMRDSSGRPAVLLAVDASAMSAMRLTAESPSVRIVEDLLAHGADAGAVDPQGESAIIAALDGYQPAMMEAVAASLGKRLEDPHQPLALSFAVRHRPVDVLRKLLAEGANPNAADSTGTMPLVRAASVGRVEAVDLLLGHGADPNVANRAGVTPLMAAGRHAAVGKRLLAAGAKVNARSERGLTPLRCSLWSQDLSLADELLRRRADPNVVDKDGGTALADAVNGGRLEAVKLLLAHHANPNQGKERARMLGVVAAGSPQMLRALLDAGADPNTREADGSTPLGFAIDPRQGDPRLGSARILLEHGADPNGKDLYGQPLVVHAVRSRPDLLTLMARKGARLDLRDQYGDTALVAAVRGGGAGTVRTLVDLGADPNLAGQGGATPLLVALQYHRTAAVSVLLSRGARVDPATAEGQRIFAAALHVPGEGTMRLLLARAGKLPHEVERDTLLNCAIIEKRADLIPILLKAGADVNGRDAQPGRMPLAVASVHGDVALLKGLFGYGARLSGPHMGDILAAWSSRPSGAAGLRYLLKRGASVRARDRGGRTPLIVAATEGNTAGMDVLVRAGARLEEEDALGGTALIRAAEAGQVGSIRWLLAHGADVNHRARWGATALKVTEYAKRPGVAEVLRRAGGKL